MALQFFGAGFFDPGRAQQALMCLDMMDFDRKQFVMEKVAQQAQMMDQTLTQGTAGNVVPRRLEPLGGSSEREPAIVQKARQRVADAAAPT